MIVEDWDPAVVLLLGDELMTVLSPVAVSVTDAPEVELVGPVGNGGAETSTEIEDAVEISEVVMFPTEVDSVL